MANTSLTKSEAQVLRLIASGKTSKETADELSVSKRTVDFHLANIFEKLGVHNRMQAVARVHGIGVY